MAKDTWALITERLTALSERNKRMDDTAALLQWDDNPYKLVKPDGKTELRDAISVTPNLPKVYAHNSIADLMSGKWQTVVEGKISARQTTIVEKFIDDNFEQADEWLRDNYGLPSLFGWLCNHVFVRWAIGTRWIGQVVKGNYQIDCLPLDMRWTPFVLGKWVAPVSFMLRDEMEQELAKYERLSKDDRVGEYNSASLGSTTEYEVRDFWSNTEHEVWVNSVLRYKEPNHLGYSPMVITIPATGFMLRDKGYLKHEGEDGLYLNAGLYRELARSISLEQTAGYAELYPAFEQETENVDGRPSQPVPNLDESLTVRKGERHQPVPRGRLGTGFQTGREDIQAMVEAGGPISPKQYNTPPSAVLLAGETELISRLQNARKEALGIHRSSLARMMLRQFKRLEGEFTIGKQGVKSKYSTSRLGDPEDYRISYRLSVKSKRQELANLAEFTAAYDKLPLKWNLENILMADDPDGIIKDLELERAKQINPALSLLEMAVKYAREAGETEDEIEAELKREQSKILTHEYVMMMRERTQSALQGRTGETAEQMKAVRGNSQLLSQLGGASGALRGEGGGNNGGRPGYPGPGRKTGVAR